MRSPDHPGKLPDAEPDHVRCRQARRHRQTFACPQAVFRSASRQPHPAPAHPSARPAGEKTRSKGSAALVERIDDPETVDRLAVL